MKITKEKYYNIKEMLQSKNEEDWVLACSLLEIELAEKKNELVIKLLIKFSNLSHYWLKNNQLSFYQSLEKIFDIEPNGRKPYISYNNIFENLNANTSTKETTGILLEEFTNSLKEDLLSVGYDFVKKINIKCEIL
jgi:hypothetical protein